MERFNTENYKKNNLEALVTKGIPRNLADYVCFKMAQHARLTSFAGTVTEHVVAVMNDKKLLKGFLLEAVAAGRV